MRKIEDGTYRAMRSDASGYVYGNYTYPIWSLVPKGQHYIKEHGQNNWITPIKMKTLVYRDKGKWVKRLFPDKEKNTSMGKLNTELEI